MTIQFRRSFDRDLAALRDQQTVARVRRAIVNVSGGGGATGGAGKPGSKPSGEQRALGILGTLGGLFK